MPDTLLGRFSRSIWDTLSRLRDRRLGTRIVLWSFLPTVAILTAVAGAAVVSYLRAAEDLAVEQNRDLARYAGGQLATELDEYAADLGEIGRLAGLGQRPTEAWGQALSQQSNRLVVFDGGVFALDPSGTVVGAVPDRADMLTEDLSNRSYFKELIHTSQPVYSDALNDGPGGSPVVAVGVPILGTDGARRGVLVGMFRLGETAVSALYGDILKLRAGGAGRAYLVDGAGSVLFHTEPDLILSNRSGRFVVRQARQGEAGAARTVDERGESVLASFGPVPGTNWILVIEQDWDSVVAPFRTRQYLLAVLIVIGVLVPGAIVTIGVRSITNPIVRLVEAAQRITRGDYVGELDTGEGGEVGELATQFKRVAVQLREAQEDLERRVEARTRDLSTLLNAVRGASGSLELDKVLDETARALAEAAQVPHCAVFLLNDRGDELAPAGAWKEAETDRGPLADLSESLDPARDSLARKVIETARPVVCSSPENGLIRWTGLQPLVAVPLASKGRVLGLALLGSLDPDRHFSPEEVELATGVASASAVAIENARLYQRLQDKVRELEGLYQADEEFLSHLDLDGVLQALVDVSIDILGADKSSIMVWDESLGSARVQAARGFDRETLELMTFKPGEGAVGRVLATRKPVFVEDSRIDDGVASRVTEPEGIRSFMHFPLEIGGRFFGVLNVDFLEPRRFSEDEIRVFAALAQRAALAIENARLYGQSRELAIVEERQRLARDLHDAVTQTLFSASLIAEVLPRIWERDQVEGKRRLEELRQLTRGALAEMRTLLLELRPAALTETDLPDLLSQLTEALTSRAGLEVDLQSHGSCPTPPEVQVALYRIAQEAFNNIAKHAKASKVMVELAFDASSGLRLTIADDGVGFDIHSGGVDHLGLGIMKERAEGLGAQIHIDSQEGEGTEISLRWVDSPKGRKSDD